MRIIARNLLLLLLSLLLLLQQGRACVCHLHVGRLQG
jgi:hypothetical protein